MGGTLRRACGPHTNAVNRKKRYKLDAHERWPEVEQRLTTKGAHDFGVAENERDIWFVVVWHLAWFEGVVRYSFAADCGGDGREVNDPTILVIALSRASRRVNIASPRVLSPGDKLP